MSMLNFSCIEMLIGQYNKIMLLKKRMYILRPAQPQ